MNRKNLVSLLDGFPGHGRDLAVVETRGYRRQTATYAELATRASSWAKALARCGIGPGDRVLLWGDNSAAWIACFWAIELQGAIAVPMDPGASLLFVQKTIADARLRLVLREKRQPKIPGAVPELTYDDSRVPLDEDFEETGSRPHPGEGAGREAIAEILYTSGTTSEPRGVVLTHGNFLANVEPLERGIEPYRKYLRWVHPLRFVSLVPLSHVFGQFMGVFVPPLLGATLVIENSIHPMEILRTTRRERATALIAVPRMLDALRGAIEADIEARGWRRWFAAAYAKAEREPFLRRAWRFRRLHRQFGWKFWAFISGGATLSEETEEFFNRIGYAVVQGYGMTESASLITLNHPFRAAKGSVGKVLPGREFKLAEDGEILVRGANVSAGYWERGLLNAPATESAGWLRTGDIGALDAEGHLRFRGRKKNVIVTPAGWNVYPEDLEAELRKQKGVRDSAVIPLGRGQNAEPCAVLLLDDLPENSASEVVRAANRGLAEYQRIAEFLVWPEPDFPRTVSGKSRTAVIAEKALKILAGERTGPDETPFGELTARFSAVPGDRSGPGPLLNLSSLDRVELMSALEQKYRVELDETSFSEAKTFEDLERLLKSPGQKHALYAYPRWAQSWAIRWFRLAAYYTLVWPATKILGRPRVVGKEKLQDLQGPVLVVSNHITRRADIGLILAALPAQFRHRLATAMGGETLERMRKPAREWFFGKRWAYRAGYWLVTALFNVFPLPQNSGFRESFRFAGQSADRGYSLLIFPEGEVNNSETGEMAAFQQGIGLLAANLSLPVIPMRLDGVWKMKKAGRRFAGRGEITVRIGEPVRFPSGVCASDIAKTLERLVRAL